MIRRRDQAGERVVRELLERLAAEVPPPSAGELTAAARRATAEPRRPERRPGLDLHRPWRPLRLRWTAAAAAAILVATGLGFGIGQWLTPAGSARPNASSGLGFLPAEGWTVLQSGTGPAASEARVVAANVPLHAADRPGTVPLRTLRSLPSTGVVIVATLTTRGDPAVDARFPVRELPLRFIDARLRSKPSEPALAVRRPTEYGLRAGVDGYNADVRLHFGSTPPSISALAAAEEQLARLVVSPRDVTAVVRSTVADGFDTITAHGSVASGRAGVKVMLQFRQCGLYPVEFRNVAEVRTGAGGGWTAEVPADANGTVRAVVGNLTSNEIALRKRPRVDFAPSPAGGYRVSIGGRLSFANRHVVVERYDPGRGAWVRVKTVPIAEAGGAGTYVWSWTDPFRLALPDGTRARVVLPPGEAGPCYLASTSRVLVTEAR